LNDAAPLHVAFVYSDTFVTVLHVMLDAQGHAPHVRPSTKPGAPVLTRVLCVNPNVGHATSPACAMHVANGALDGGAHTPIAQPPPTPGASHVAPGSNVGAGVAVIIPAPVHVACFACAVDAK
jgi:hypothetical protein